MLTYRTRRSTIRSLLRSVRYAINAPSWVVHEDNECRFYSQFIRWGGLCFDIGANVGDKTHVFHMLGSRVVSVDPLPCCARTLEQRFRDCAVVVVEAAVGDEEGTVTLHAGDHSTISSILPDWIQRNPTQLSGRAIAHSFPVRLTTLDQLIHEHGIPDFCKIDVEGFEPAVFKGLTIPLPFVSFEWTADTLNDAHNSIGALVSLGHYEFNFSYSSPLKFECDRWLSGESLIDAIQKSLTKRTNARWGDAFARLAK